MSDKNAPYVEAGFENRVEYLKDLAKQYGVSETIVFELASVLGRNEDFDGLVSALEDMDSSESDEDEW